MKRKIFIFLLLIITLTIIVVIPSKEVKADGGVQYSIEYLLKNYNVVTFGQKDNNTNMLIHSPLAGKGDIVNATNIEGAILVSGNYTSQYSSTFATNAGGVKSFIKGTKGSNVTTSSQLVTDSNFVDFEQMYIHIVNEQKMLLEKTTENIIGPEIKISSPGVYTIHNSATTEYETNAQGDISYSGDNRIFIQNYDKNALYVFNVYDEIATTSYNMVITQSSSPTAMSFDELVNSGNYTGNILWNFPKAKYIAIDGYQGSIIAPKADVNYAYYNNKKGLLVNSIYSYNSNPIGKALYSSASKIIEEESNSYLDESKDYSDDFYSGSYSITELLQNYSLVSLGKKNLESKTVLSQKGQNPGAVRLFHAAGPVLINGDLYGEVINDSYLESMRLDLEGNTVNESYVKGNTFVQLNYNGYPSTARRAFIQSWDNVTNSRNYYAYRNNKLFIGTVNDANFAYNYYNTTTTNSFINFDRLYEKIVAQQQEIKEGIKVGKEGRIAHIPVGGNYVIENINELDEIVFDDFEKNKNLLTIVTIKNSGDINFPFISKDTGSYKGIVTNDYYNKTEATHSYEIDHIVNDSYHGNIIWNVPNATYIKLKENAPFAGHLIAPKADVETPELHFSGCFIVNSLYAEGNTEAHFYPLTSYSTYKIPDYSSLPKLIFRKLNEKRLGNLLGLHVIEADKEILGDEAQYRDTENTINALLQRETEGMSFDDILNNPKTYQNIGIFILIAGVIVSSIIISKNNKKKNNT